MIEKAYYKFMGFDRETEKDLSRVIITNIEPIYKMLTSRGALLKSYRGFYENSIIDIDGVVYHLIRITPGNTIIDVIKLIKDTAKYIFLVGLAGGIKECLEIGQVVSPSTATIMDDLTAMEDLYVNDKSEGTVCQTDGLIQTEDFYKKLQQLKIDFVDMESYYLASMCKEYKLKGKVVSIISDKPLTEPFYDCTMSKKPDVEDIIKHFQL